jgi:plasmid stabilization system protein ParE
MARKRPSVVSTRATKAERLLVEALAEQEGVSVAEMVHRILVEGVRHRLQQIPSAGYPLAT